jgi:hypothetical protein
VLRKDFDLLNDPAHPPEDLVAAIAASSIN